VEFLWRPKRATCPVWALRQKWRWGGEVRFVHNPSFPHWAFWMFRTIWREPHANIWWSYVPLEPRRNLLQATIHKIWFKGEPRRIRAHK